MIPTCDGFVKHHMFVPCHKEIHTLKRNRILQTNFTDWKEKETVMWDRLERNVVAQGYFSNFFLFFGGGGEVTGAVETENSMKKNSGFERRRLGSADVQLQIWEALDCSRKTSRDTDF